MPQLNSPLGHLPCVSITKIITEDWLGKGVGNKDGDIGRAKLAHLRFTISMVIPKIAGQLQEKPRTLK